MLSCDVERLANESGRAWPPGRAADEPPHNLRRVAWGAVVLAALALLALLVGCCPVELQDVRSLREAIQKERRAVTPRKGFEAAIAVERAGVDAKLDAMEEAHK